MRFPALTVLWTAALIALMLQGCAPRYVREGTYLLGDGDRRQVVLTAREYVGVPYKNGGTSPSGFDCSGYVMYVFSRNGLAMPRTTEDQFISGRRIRGGRLRPGDLVFFTIKGRGVSHVGIYAGRGAFLHAPRTGKRVSFASLKNPYWKRHYTGAVTYFHGNSAGYDGRMRSSATIHGCAGNRRFRGSAAP